MASDEPGYLNDVLDGYEGYRCQFRLHWADDPRGVVKACGLPVWAGAPEEMPQCEFHSSASPDDILQRLENAVAGDAMLFRSQLAGLDLRGGQTLEGSSPPF